MAEEEGRGARPRAAQSGPARRSHRSSARRALRRRTSARRDRPGPLHLPAHPARRRTHRQPRHAHRTRNSCAHPRSARPARLHGSDRDARSRRGRKLPPRDRPPRRTHRRRSRRSLGSRAMILLRLITWPYIRRHLLRSILTATGIVLGVAVFVGMHTANESVLYAFRQTVDRIAGATQLQITAGEAGFDEDVLDRVQAMSPVNVAVPVIEAVASTGVKGEGNALILGVDMTGDRSLRDYDVQGGSEDVIDDPLVFLAQPDSIIVTDTLARENGLHVGSKLPMSTMQGEKQFTVRGIMKSGGLTSAFGGNLAVMDIYAAQKIFGRGRRFDRIDVTLRDGVPL